MHWSRRGIPNTDQGTQLPHTGNAKSFDFMIKCQVCMRKDENETEEKSK